MIRRTELEGQPQHIEILPLLIKNDSLGSNRVRESARNLQAATMGNTRASKLLNIFLAHLGPLSPDRRRRRLECEPEHQAEMLFLPFLPPLVNAHHQHSPLRRLRLCLQRIFECAFLCRVRFLQDTLICCFYCSGSGFCCDWLSWPTGVENKSSKPTCSPPLLGAASLSPFCLALARSGTGTMNE